MPSMNKGIEFETFENGPLPNTGRYALYVNSDGNVRLVDDSGNEETIATTSSLSGGSGNDSTLIGGVGIGVVESPDDTWTISVSGDYATNSLVQSVSGNLQSQIDTNVSNILNLQTNVSTISADFDNYTLLTTTENLTANLQSQINNIEVPASDVLGTGLVDITAQASIIPDTSGAYDLGSLEKPWRSGYFTNNSVYFGNQKLSVENGEVKINNQSITVAATNVIYETTLSSIQDEIDITGLNHDALIVEVLVYSNVSSDYYLYPNGDTTNSNYRFQISHSNNLNIGGDKGSIPKFGFTGFAGTYSSAIGQIRTGIRYQCFSETLFQVDINNNNYYNRSIKVDKVAGGTPNPITTLKLKGAGTNVFGVGTRVRVIDPYKAAGGGTQITNSGVDVSTMELSGGIPTSLVPDASGAYDLGSAEKPWRELYLIGNTIYLGDKPVSLTGNRLTFNTTKTLAYTDEVEAVSSSVVTLSGSTTALAAESNKVITEVNQEGHGFSVLDAVYNDPHDNLGAFTNTSVWNEEGVNSGRVVEENILGEEPIVTYDSSTNSYYMSCYAGIFYGASSANTTTEKSLFFLSKPGSGDGDLQCIMDSQMGLPGTTNFYSASGLMIKSSTGAIVTFLYGGITYGPGYTFIYTYGSIEGPTSWKTNKIASLPNKFSDFGNCKIKFQVDGNRIRVYIQKIGTNVDFIEENGGDELLFPDGTWDNYNIGFVIAGGHSMTNSNYYQTTATVKEIDGSLSVSSGENSKWELAGGGLAENEAEGIVVEVSDENNFKVATSGIITIPNGFVKSSISYLSQTVAGQSTYSPPVGRVQKLWKGLSSDEAQLILGKSPDGAISYVDENGVSSLLPEVTGQSGLGTSSCPWGNVYANDVILDGSSLSTRQTNLENTISADIASISASVEAFSATLSGSALSYNIEGSSSSLISDQIVSFTTVDYEFDEEGLESGGQYTVHVDGVYKFECDMTINVNAGTITNTGLRINGSFVTGFNTGPFGGFVTITKTRIIQLSVGDTVDWYHDDNTNGGTTYSGWWYIHKL